MIKSLDEYDQILLIEGLFFKKNIQYDELIQTLEQKSSNVIKKMRFSRNEKWRLGAEVIYSLMLFDLFLMPF